MGSFGSGIKRIQRGTHTLTNTSGKLTGTISLPVDVDVSKTTITKLDAYGPTTAICSLTGQISDVDEITVIGNTAVGSATGVTAVWEIQEVY